MKIFFPLKRIDVAGVWDLGLSKNYNCNASNDRNAISANKNLVKVEGGWLVAIAAATVVDAKSNYRQNWI